MNNISQFLVKLIKNILCFLLVLIIFNEAFAGRPSIKNHENIKVELRLAVTEEQIRTGLSGVKPAEFSTSEGMLFVNMAMAPRRFWMPNTYFDLDIIFLDQNFKIVGLEKNVPAHPGFKEPPKIYQTQTYVAQYILETKAGSAFSKNLKKGDQLKFLGSPTLLGIAPNTHQKQ